MRILLKGGVAYRQKCKERNLLYTIKQTHLVKLTAVQQISNADTVASQKAPVCQVKLLYHLSHKAACHNMAGHSFMVFGECNMGYQIAVSPVCSVSLQASACQ